MSAIRVALVDDQALFRAGVRMLVESQPDLEFVGEAGDGVEGVDARGAVAARRRAHGHPDAGAWTASRRPSASSPPPTRDGRTAPRIIVLTTFDLDENAARAIRAGASGFVLKDAEPEFLLAAIRTVHRGNAGDRREPRPASCSSTSARGSGRGPRRPRGPTLTPREREIFVLAARGLSATPRSRHPSSSARRP